MSESNEVAARRVQVRITAHELREWRTMAEETGQALSTLVRRALNQFVADYGERPVFRSRSRRS